MKLYKDPSENNHIAINLRSFPKEYSINNDAETINKRLKLF